MHTFYCSKMHKSLKANQEVGLLISFFEGSHNFSMNNIFERDLPNLSERLPPF